MSNVLDDREHAAENLFAHNEEQSFLAHRAAMRDLGAWASQGMRLDAAATLAYQDKVVDALVGGSRDEQILAVVQTDLERAGKPAMSTMATTVLAQAIARASDELAGRAAPRPLGWPGATRKRTHPIDASLSWLG